ncbi:hypothetical protein G7054_g9756 [Neopestalotiopsis clavispora]|nr:hypothetical protein G7054_g9756 [Neopestalotiopsis clavispora]
MAQQIIPDTSSGIASGADARSPSWDASSVDTLVNTAAAYQTMPRLEAQPQDGHEEEEEEGEAARREQAGAVVGILLCIGTVAIFWAIVYCMNKWVHEAATQRQASLRHNGYGRGW